MSGNSLLRARDLLLSEVADIDTGIERLSQRRIRLMEAAQLLAEKAMQGDDGRGAGLPGAEVDGRGNGSAPSSQKSEPREPRVPGPSRVSTPQAIRNHMSRAPERWFTSYDLREETGRKSSQIAPALSVMVAKGVIEREGTDRVHGRGVGTLRWQYRWVGARDIPTQEEPHGEQHG